MRVTQSPLSFLRSWISYPNTPLDLISLGAFHPKIGQWGVMATSRMIMATPKRPATVVMEDDLGKHHQEKRWGNHLSCVIGTIDNGAVSLVTSLRFYIFSFDH